MKRRGPHVRTRETQSAVCKEPLPSSGLSPPFPPARPLHGLGSPARPLHGPWSPRASFPRSLPTHPLLRLPARPLPPGGQRLRGLQGAAWGRPGGRGLHEEGAAGAMAGSPPSWCLPGLSRRPASRARCARVPAAPLALWASARRARSSPRRHRGSAPAARPPTPTRRSPPAAPVSSSAAGGRPARCHGNASPRADRPRAAPVNRTFCRTLPLAFFWGVGKWVA